MSLSTHEPHESHAPAPARERTSARPSSVPQPPAPARAQGGIRFGLLWAVPALALASFSANPMLTTAAVASLVAIILLLWRPAFPPVLLFVVFMQWLQGAMMVLHADILGVELWTLTYAHHVEDAVYLTLAWVTVLATGMWLVLRSIPLDRISRADATQFSLRKLLFVYGAWIVGLQLAYMVAPPQARQLINAFVSLRWMVVFAVFVWTVNQKRGRALLSMLVLVEVAVGFLSFFSDFKSPLYMLAIALATSGYRPTTRQYLSLAIVGTFTIYLGVVWSAVKMDYRDHINGGTGGQVVVVSVEEQVEEFVQLLGTIDGDVLDRGLTTLVERIAYVEYLAYVIDYVPAQRKHEDGRLWMNALTHVLTPRLFFPDKEALESDTSVAERYTGLSLESDKQTSIALGLPAETYIDLGKTWMFAVALALGIMFGFTFRYFIIRKEAGLIAQGFAVAVHQSLATIEVSPSKVLGGHLAVFVIALIAWHVGVPPLLRYLRRT